MINVKNMLILFIALASSACAISKKENDRAENQIKAETISDNILLNDSISDENLKYFDCYCTKTINASCNLKIKMKIQ